MASTTLALWRTLSGKPAGAWVFSKLVCWKAPYFATIRPRFVTLEPGRAEVRMPKRRAVHNHIGTVHAIAMCNLAELAGGTMTDASIPPTHRWIPVGMTVEYLKKATTDLSAVATRPPGQTFALGVDVPVTVEVSDATGQPVFRAVITMRVSPKPAR